VKITKSQLKQIIKEELNEISQKQRGHEARLSVQMDEKEKKEALVRELKDLLPSEYYVHLKYLKDESRYVVIVYKQADVQWDVHAEEEEPEVDPETGAPESPQKMGHPYDYPPGEEWRHKY